MRRVFVTGGADGIGKTIVKAFRMAGHRVAFCDWNEESGKETAEKTGTTFYPVDINNKEALENCMHHILEDWGDLDIIINNAGISKFASLTETSVEDFIRKPETGIYYLPSARHSPSITNDTQSVRPNYQHIVHSLPNKQT